MVDPIGEARDDWRWKKILCEVPYITEIDIKRGATNGRALWNCAGETKDRRGKAEDKVEDVTAHVQEELRLNLTDIIETQD